MHTWIQATVDVLIVVMAVILALFTVTLVILHIITTSNNIRVQRIKKRIMRMLSVSQDLEYLRGQIYELLDPEGEIRSLREIRGIQSSRGSIAMTMVVEEADPERKELLRKLILRDDWYCGHIRRMLRSRSIDQVGVFTKLAAELQLPDYEEEIYRNLHRWTDSAENQEISLLALFMSGCEEKLIALFTDPAFRLILSFRQLHELFDCYSGDPAELYRKLLARDCDLYVKRACVRGIGNEGLAELSPLIEPYLTSEHMNLLIDSVRSAGKLRYRPAEDIIRRHTSHREWSVRSVAVTALADIAPEACYEDLLRCLCDPEWWVRFHAAEALSRLRGHEDLMEDVTGLGDRFAYEMMRYILERNALLGREVTA